VGAGTLEVLEVVKLSLVAGKVYRGSCVGWGMSNSIMYLNYVRNTDPFAASPSILPLFPTRKSRTSRHFCAPWAAMPQEPPEPQGPLQAALRDSTVAATTRASEGHALFSPIAVFLDKHRREVSDLNPHLPGALASLSDDLASVAQRHFDAFICGVPAPRAVENTNSRA
jgi:hypothetical protein